MRFQTLERWIGVLARALALAGGAVLVALVIMTCISIAGRAAVPLGGQPVPGDFELIEIGIGVAIFAFLPWCQFDRGHARVDLLERLFGRVSNALLDLISDIAMCAAAVLIGWRLWAGLSDKFRYGETTFILQFPVWWGYAAGMVGAAAFALVAAFCIWRSVRAFAHPEAGAHDTLGGAR